MLELSHLNHSHGRKLTCSNQVRVVQKRRLSWSCWNKLFCSVNDRHRLVNLRKFTTLEGVFLMLLQMWCHPVQILWWRIWNIFVGSLNGGIASLDFGIFESLGGETFRVWLWRVVALIFLRSIVGEFVEHLLLKVPQGVGRLSLNLDLRLDKTSFLVNLNYVLSSWIVYS